MDTLHSFLMLASNCHLVALQVSSSPAGTLTRACSHQQTQQGPPTPGGLWTSKGTTGMHITATMAMGIQAAAALAWMLTTRGVGLHQAAAPQVATPLSAAHTATRSTRQC